MPEAPGFAAGLLRESKARWREPGGALSIADAGAGVGAGDGGVADVVQGRAGAGATSAGAPPGQAETSTPTRSTSSASATTAQIRMRPSRAGRLATCTAGRALDRKAGPSFGPALHCAWNPGGDDFLLGFFGGTGRPRQKLVAF
jgi:hypothetical protein